MAEKNTDSNFTVKQGRLYLMSIILMFSLRKHGMGLWDKHYWLNCFSNRSEFKCCPRISSQQCRDKITQGENNDYGNVTWFWYSATLIPSVFHWGFVTKIWLTVDACLSSLTLPSQYWSHVMLRIIEFIRLYMYTTGPLYIAVIWTESIINSGNFTLKGQSHQWKFSLWNVFMWPDLQKGDGSLAKGDGPICE